MWTPLPQHPLERQSSAIVRRLLNRVKSHLVELWFKLLEQTHSIIFTATPSFLTIRRTNI